MALLQNVQSTTTNTQKNNNDGKKYAVLKFIVIHIAQKQRTSKQINKESNRTANVTFTFQMNLKNIYVFLLFILTYAIFTYPLFRTYSVCMYMYVFRDYGSVFNSVEAISCSPNHYFYVVFMLFYLAKLIYPRKDNVWWYSAESNVYCLRKSSICE